MSSVFRKITDDILGIDPPKKEKVEEEDETPTVIPVADDPSIREKMIKAEKDARKKRGRAYTRDPGMGSGTLDTIATLG